RRSSSETAYGLYGARNGAKMAVKTSAPITTRPTSAARFLRSTAQARDAFPRTGLAGTSMVSAAASAIPHPRIDNPVKQIDPQVDQRHDQGGDQDDPLDERIVALADSANEQTADARPGEDRFHQNRPAEERTHLD